VLAAMQHRVRRHPEVGLFPFLIVAIEIAP
jgi:hypothetical protein